MVPSAAGRRAHFLLFCSSRPRRANNRSVYSLPPLFCGISYYCYPFLPIWLGAARFIFGAVTQRLGSHSLPQNNHAIIGAAAQLVRSSAVLEGMQVKKIRANST
ncbi:hypothetical protein CDAR_613111 [Caerostris darwini]|uniref:Uncharacterized protein n=1 Tax=Caerostris darwini TaxID=1538125 RepID=A0AAV4ULR3_9ARAC|nr:hypothetical protein CDAR_613111 [Caerostris darwini]